MKLINEKKIPVKAVSVILYVSMCLGCWYYARMFLAYAAIVYLVETAALVIANTISAMLLFGLFLYAVVNMMLSQALHPSRLLGVNNGMLVYVFKLVLICANLVHSALSLLFLLSPVIGLYGDLVLRFLVTTLFMFFGFAYAYKNGFIPKDRMGKTLYAAGGTYLIFYVIAMTLKIFLFYASGVM